jgi:hypothetical protein
MSNYFYFQQEQRRLNERFNAGANFGEGYTVDGLKDWQELMKLLIDFLSDERGELEDPRARVLKELQDLSGISNIDLIGERSTEELILTLLLVRLRKYPVLPQDRCPRLFISHRQSDKKYALRIAKLALKNGFACWLDILDPVLQRLPYTGIHKDLISFVTACIIEMALINCTHVIACMTPQTRGSLWVPYEYGRITRVPSLTRPAAAWVHPDLDKADYPGYMLLGHTTCTEYQIESWLNDERRLLNKLYCDPRQQELPLFREIESLPDESTEIARLREERIQQWLDAGMPLIKEVKRLSPIRFRIIIKE